MARKKTRKKAQHEMVGFVLIVVIVVVIGLILLVFYIRQEPAEYKSKQVSHFLQSSMLYTTPCYLSVEPLNMQDLIKSAKKNQKCLNDEMAHDVLNESFSKLTHEAWLVSSDKPVKAYFIDIYYKEEDSVREDILSLREGNCTGSKIGSRHPIPNYPGNIILDMEICYS